MFDLTFAEARVLGCLIEKAATTPDSYPLTLNALRNACNQSTSRDPVVDFDDSEVEAALASLRERGIIRKVLSTSNRATKYRHTADEVYRLDDGELALVGVLLLRGRQTVGELKQRTERQHRFGSSGETEACLSGLAGRDEPLVEQLERQPGQKDARWVQVLSGPASPNNAAGDEPTGEAMYDFDSKPVVRVARPCRELDVLVEQYSTGLGWSVTATFSDHAGYDGAVLTSPDGAVELEFVHVRLDPEPPTPHDEHLTVVYVDTSETLAAVHDRLIASGFDRVGNPNPYWEQHGRTYADLEGGRLVISVR